MHKLIKYDKNMIYSIEGKLVEKGAVVQISENFKKREFVIEKKETVGQKEFIDHIKFEITQDKVNLIDSFSEGEEVQVEFNVRGRKWKKDGKTSYFNSLQAWRLSHVAANQSSSGAEMPPIDDNDPLPF